MDENWSPLETANRRRIYRGSCTMVWYSNMVHFAFRWLSFKREFLSSNTSLKKHWFTMRGWVRFGYKSAEFKLSADSKHCESYYDTKHRNVWFRTLSTKAIHVFLAQFLLNKIKRYIFWVSRDQVQDLSRGKLSAHVSSAVKTYQIQIHSLHYRNCRLWYTLVKQTKWIKIY